MNNAIFIGWNHPNIGKEKQSIEHFKEFLGFLTKHQQQGNITSFTPVFLEQHGGDLNGFILIQGGENGGLMKLMNDDTYQDHISKAIAWNEGFGSLPAYTGKELENRMKRYAKFV